MRLCLPLRTTGLRMVSFRWICTALYIYLLSDELFIHGDCSSSGYEIITPIQVDQSGQFLTYNLTPNSKFSRQRRGAQEWLQQSEDSDKVYYSINTFGKSLGLTLSLNTRLLSKDFRLEFWNKKGLRKTAHTRRPCFYTGTVNSTRGRAALSNCDGLTGVISVASEQFFISPLTYVPNRDSSGRPHVIAKHSEAAPEGFSNDSFCATPDVVPAPVNTSSPPLSQGRKPVVITPSPRHRVERSVSKERWVETLVVADQFVVNHHGMGEVETFILSVMNIVSSLFHDESVGNAINIVVTRVIFLLDDQDDLLASHQAETYLESFCLWQTNLKSDNSTDHDNAILFTRKNICTLHDSPCGTVGLAPVSGICLPERSCSVSQDVGLASAFTIAHELGHNFGMQHDGSNNLCGTEGHEPAKLMAQQMVLNTDPWAWSSCSREYITTFLDSGRAQCLDNEPKLMYEYNEEYPGELHPAREQCQLQFHPGSLPCNKKNICKELWCTAVEGYCTTNSIPPADGTECKTRGVRHGWCYKGECVPYGIKPTPVDGGWGEWTLWGLCSRSCGGGVEASWRDCTNPLPQNEGKYCLGERTRYRSCNTGYCPGNQTDFRAIQCAQTDHIAFRDELYQWLPYTGPSPTPNPCTLFCVAVGFNFYAERAPKVIDGTPCRSEDYDICVNGECMEVGCDKKLSDKKLSGTKVKEDKCGVCDGRGRNCRTVKGVYTESYNFVYRDTYRRVVSFPAGATSLRVEESVVSDNFLAIMNDDEQYYLNGDWVIDWARRIPAAGTVFVYSRPDGEPESLTAKGPLSEIVHIMILVQGTNPGIKWEYSMKSDRPELEAIVSQIEDLSQHTWVDDGWSLCSVTCGSGIRRSLLKCVSYETRQRVPHTECSRIDRPVSEVAQCSQLPCPPEWTFAPWGECSRTCGRGTRTRVAECVGADISETYTEDSFESDPFNFGETTCDPLLKPEQEVEVCGLDAPPCPAKWKIAGWSPCSATCGGDGTRFPLFRCMRSWAEVEETECNQITRLPIQGEPCEEQAPCVGIWAVSDWGVCSESCGDGIRKRHRTCTMGGKVVGEEWCADSGVMPPLERPCVRKVCGAAWRAGGWSACEGECGRDGVKRRQFFCIKEREIVSRTECVKGKRIPSKETVTCSMRPCPAMWRFGNWSSCTVTCGGGGQQVRRAVCTRETVNVSLNTTIFEELPKDTCNDTKQPIGKIRECSGSEKCEEKARWVWAAWSVCSKTCGGGIRERGGACWKGTTAVSDEICSYNGTQSLKVQTEHCSVETCPAEWLISDWASCSKTCGGGTMKRRVSCQSGGERVPHLECRSSPRPEKSRKCASNDCPTHWAVGSWTACSVSCGLDGVMTRSVQCATGHADDDNHDSTPVVVSDTSCTKSPRPVSHKPCNVLLCPPIWVHNSWSNCSVTCGPGRQSRRVSCMQSDVTVNSSLCDVSTRPDSLLECELPECPLPTMWVVSDWTECNAPCGEIGRRSRGTACVFDDGEEGDKKIAPALACDFDSRPAIEEVCQGSDCPSPEWVVDDWGDCSVTCGGGRMTRDVSCLLENDEEVDVQECTEPRPPSSERCNEGICPAFWRTESWSECTATCGVGHRSRQAECARPGSNQTLPSSNCDMGNRPTTVQVCSNDPCPTIPIALKWVTADWGECSSSCGQGYQTRGVTCQDSSSRSSFLCDLETRPEMVQPCHSECEPDMSESSCQDDPSMPYCDLVREINYCNRQYFLRRCCATCNWS